MATRVYPTDDFEATIRIFTPEEGGRRAPAFNGIRWDFAYVKDEPLNLYMIRPYFITADVDSVAPDKLLPTNVDLPARMTIVNDDIRKTVHRHRIKPGVQFFCYEGGRRVAEGIVTRVTGLFNERVREITDVSGMQD